MNGQYAMMVHGTIAALCGATQHAGLLFKLGSLEPLNTTSTPEFRERLSLHFWGKSHVAVINDLNRMDLQQLLALGANVFVRHFSSLAPDFHPADLTRMLDASNVAPFYRFGTPDAVRYQCRRHALIGTTEFLLSGIDRLNRFPTLSAATPTPGSVRRTKLVFVLDLVQDFEVLRPLLARAAWSDHNFAPVVAVTPKTMDSYNWANVKAFLDGAALAWVQAKSPVAIVDLLGNASAILVTASESSAPAHATCYRACLMAPSRTVKVTMQHGYENIGLRHHLAHDQSLRAKVRFASDIVFTWAHAEQLDDLHPMEIDKCIPVGITKNFAEISALARERAQDAAQGVSEPGPASLLVAENLHSVRFANPARHQRFLEFIRDVKESTSYRLTVRSHPAIRKLQTSKLLDGLNYLDGDLTVETVRKFDLVISPPSTIVLDAVLAGTPVAVWSDSSAVGDVQNYVGLRTVADEHDLNAVNSLARASSSESDMAWAVANTTSLNGVPYLWNSLIRLAV